MSARARRADGALPVLQQERVVCQALAINVGLAHLRLEDWVVHLDADTALPRNTRKHLANIELDPSCIYGIDRVDCPSLEAWKSYLTDPDPYAKHYFYHGPRDWRVGSRVGHFDYGGYAPIGFFQLWNRASGITRYPSVQGCDAEHTDMLHALQWPRVRQRVLIPEITAVHLSTGGREWGVNWHGRKTPRFAAAPSVPTRLDPSDPSGCVRTRQDAQDRRSRLSPSTPVPGRLPPSTAPDAVQAMSVQSTQVGFRIRGIEPTDLSTYPDRIKLMFWGWVTEAALAGKDRELARGWDKDGNVHPLKPRTIKYRKIGGRPGPQTRAPAHSRAGTFAGAGHC